jgi:hypothetical protein
MDHLRHSRAARRIHRLTLAAGAVLALLLAATALWVLLRG